MRNCGEIIRGIPHQVRRQYDRGNSGDNKTSDT